MPQLPSGRHVAIQATPLVDLLDHANEAANVHRVMAIDSAEKVLEYFEILYLVPPETVDGSFGGIELREGSDTPPENLVMVPAGLRISEFRTAKADWSVEDQDAFQTFLDTRAQAFIQQALNEVDAKKKQLLHGGGGLSQILAAWYAAGVHPAQEEGWDESDVGEPSWDDYDVLAALGQIRKLLPEHPQFLERWQTQARLEGMWPVLTKELSLSPEWPDPQQSVRDCADQLRNTQGLDRLPDQKRNWIHDQAIVELVELWNVLGDGFRAAMPQPYGIAELVVCSADANHLFSGDESDAVEKS